MDIFDPSSRCPQEKYRSLTFALARALSLLYIDNLGGQPVSMNRHRYRLIGNRYRSCTTRVKDAVGKISKVTPQMLLHFTITMRGAAKAFPARRSIKPSPSPLQNANAKYTRTDSWCTIRTATWLRMCMRAREKESNGSARARREKCCENQRRSDFCAVALGIPVTTNRTISERPRANIC